LIFPDGLINLLKSFIILGHQNDPGGVFIQPVGTGRSEGKICFRVIITLFNQIVDGIINQRKLFSFIRLGEHFGWFIENQQVIIFINNIENGTIFVQLFFS
jgi:hypothetical protein